MIIHESLHNLNQKNICKFLPNNNIPSNPMHSIEIKKSLKECIKTTRKLEIKLRFTQTNDKSNPTGSRLRIGNQEIGGRQEYRLEMRRLLCFQGLVDGWPSLGASWTMIWVSMGGRSLVSSSSSSSESVALRLMHDHRSSDAKKAEATLAPTQLATRSSVVGAVSVEFSIAGTLTKKAKDLLNGSSNKEKLMVNIKTIFFPKNIYIYI